MSPLTIRRATLDDLPALRSLWEVARLPVDELEGRLTEFHVVLSGGSFAGGIGLQIVRQHARIHSEDYADFSVADPARELFWDRFQKLASNHGVFRVWTQETSPFWTHWGFQPANAELLGRLPDEWKAFEGRWLTLELKNEEAINEALKTQFTGFRDTEKKHTERIAAHGRTIRVFFTVIFFVLGIIGIALAVYLLFRHPLTTQ